MVLDDASLTNTGQSSADVLGVPGTVVSAKLTSHLLREVMARGLAEDRWSRWLTNSTTRSRSVRANRFPRMVMPYSVSATSMDRFWCVTMISCEVSRSSAAGARDRLGCAVDSTAMWLIRPPCPGDGARAVQAPEQVV